MTERIDRRISAADWEVTPDSVKTVLVELSGKVADLSTKFKNLSEEMAPLSAQVEQLEQKVSRRPCNSSKQIASKGFGNRAKRRKRKEKH